MSLRQPGTKPQLRCFEPLSCCSAIQMAGSMHASLSKIWMQDRTLKLWNPHRGVLVKTYQGHGHDVRDVAVSADNSK